MLHGCATCQDRPGKLAGMHLLHKAPVTKHGSALQDMARVARWMAGKAVGLVLSGGGSRQPAATPGRA